MQHLHNKHLASFDNTLWKRLLFLSVNQYPLDIPSQLQKIMENLTEIRSLMLAECKAVQLELEKLSMASMQARRPRQGFKSVQGHR